MQRPSPRIRPVQFSYARYPSRDLYGDAMLSIRMGTNMAAGNQQKHLLLPEFFNESVNLSIEELINIKVILFLIHELFRQQTSRNKSLLTYMTAFSAACECRVMQKAQKFKRILPQNQEPFRGEKLYECQFSAALINHKSKISVGSIVQQFEFNDVM